MTAQPFYAYRSLQSHTKNNNVFWLKVNWNSAKLTTELWISMLPKDTRQRINSSPVCSLAYLLFLSPKQIQTVNLVLCRYGDYTIGLIYKSHVFTAPGWLFWTSRLMYVKGMYWKNIWSKKEEHFVCVWENWNPTFFLHRVSISQINA